MEQPSPDLQQKIQEIQILEQSIQALLGQKQNLQLELNEAENALIEVGKSDDEVYRIIGNAMIKSPKDKVIADLEEKKKLLDLRLSSLEKQDSALQEKAMALQQEISKEMGSASEEKEEEKSE
tara:strand:+ start:3656 stop:4024 length:369 start_codon:yes stop_codon:yes gene_type:complete